MAFDPDQYLNSFDPDKYLGGFNPDDYLKGAVPGRGGAIGGIAEPIISMASQIPAMIAGGFTGLASLPQGVDKAVENSGKVMKAMTYDPVTQAGKENTEWLGKQFEHAGEFAGNMAMAKPPVSPETQAWRDKMNARPGDQPAISGVMTPQESLQYGLGKGTFEFAASTADLPARLMGKVIKTPMPDNAMAAKIQEAIDAKKRGAEPMQQTPAYSGQEEMNLEPPITDQTGLRNPYDTAGYVSASEQGKATNLPGQMVLDNNANFLSGQGDLFGQAEGKTPGTPEPTPSPKPPEPTPAPKPPEPTPAPRATIDLTAKDAWKQYATVGQQEMFSQMEGKLSEAIKQAQIEKDWSQKQAKDGWTKDHEYNLMELQREAERLTDIQGQADIIHDTHRAIFEDTSRAIHKFVDDVTGVVDHMGVLRDIAKGGDRLLKSVAKFILDNPEILRDYKVVAIMDKDGNILPRLTDEQGVSYMGEYFGATHTTYLSNGGLKERAFMHELMHAATVRAYQTNPALKAKVDAIYNELRDRLNWQYREVEGTQTKVIGHNNNGWVYHYGMKNPLEMLAEVFTNREFRKFLSNTAPYRSLWTRIKDAIQDTLGIKSKGDLNNFLDRIDKVGEELVKFHTEQNLSNAEVYTRMRFNSQPDWPTRIGDFDTPMRKDADQREAMSGIPGMKEVMDNMIPDYKDVKDFLVQIAQEKDVSKRNALISGGIQKAEMKKSTGMYAVYDWFSTADKKSNFAERTMVNPTERIVDRLYNKNREGMRQLFSIITQESDKQVRMTAEELKQLGLSDDVIAGHEAFRDMMDDVFQKQVEKGAQMTGREGYFASRFQGPWGAPVIKDGKLVWYIKAPTRSGALAAKTWIEKNVPGIDKIKDPEYKSSPLASRVNNVEAGYNTLVEFLGDKDPAVATLKDAWERYQTLEGIHALDQSKHWTNQSGVRGAAGDRPWMKSDKDMLEAMKEQFKYARNGYRWSELQEATSRVKDLTKEMEDKPNTVKMIRDYTKNQLGIGTDFRIRHIEDLVGEQISKYSPFSGNEILETTRSLFFIKELGMFNVPFSITQVLQPMFTNPEHFRLSGEGYKHNPIRTIAESIHDGWAIFARNAEMLAPNSEAFRGVSDAIKAKYKDPRIVEMAEYARQNGLIQLNQFSDIRNLGNPTRQMFERVGGFNLIATEAISRSMAWAGFVSHLEQSGKFTSRMDVFKRAEELTNLTMVDYRHFERSDVFNKTGLTGRMLSTLQTFHINQWNNLWRYAKMAKDGNVAPLLAMAATQLTFAGTTGFFGMQALDTAWESMKPFMPTKWLDFGVKKFLITHMPDYASYGPMSSVTGANWSTRFGADTIWDPSPSSILPFASEAYKTGKAAFLLGKDRDIGRAKDLGYQLTPAAAKGPVDAAMYKRDQLKNGNTLYSPTNDYAEGIPFERSPEDVTKRWENMRTNSEAAKKELNYRERITEAELTARKQRYTENFKRNIILGDAEAAQQSSKDYVEAGGQPDELKKIVEDTMTKQHLDYANRILIKAQASIHAAQRAGRFKEQLDYVKKNYK